LDELAKAMRGGIPRAEQVDGAEHSAHPEAAGLGNRQEEERNG
jgi:hypothetical protein